MNANKWLVTHDLNGEELFYDFCLESNDFANIFTPEINEYLSRHKMLKDYGIMSFNNDFDTLPAVWIDVIELIDKNIMNAMQAKSKK